MKYFVGVDEAGRGPLAGPVAVGVAIVAKNFDWDLLPGVTDSKKLSEKKREEIFLKAKALKKAGELDYAVSMTGAHNIDRNGIITAINRSIDRALERVEKGIFSPRQDLGLEKCCVKLDGGLRAPERCMHQETIIKGDQKEKVIGLASIMAKVTRDRYMTRLASLAAYQPYDFHIHKGYGTKKHREAIAKYGLSKLHRVSYCKRIEVL